MASIGGISFEFDDRPSPTAVAFWLDKKAALDVEHQLDTGWKISIRRGEDLVVARSKNALEGEQAWREAREAMEETLDLICFRLNEPLLLKPLDGNRLIIETENGKRMLTCRMRASWPVRVGPISMIARDAEGNEILARSTRPIWRPVLRYYRLSQTRENMFDAYRYMFLALEALLYSQWPLIRKPKESEIAWLIRSVRELGKQINLGPFLPTPAPDPAKAFVDSQYTAIRLPLFHAKKSADTLAHEGLSEEALGPAYARLTQLVRHAINEILKLQGQSGVITNVVFQSQISGLLETRGLVAAFGFDDRPVSNVEEPLSPKGKAVIRFDKLEAEPPSNSGTRLVTASLNLTNAMPKRPVHRLGLLAEEKSILICAIENPLDLSGLDIFRFELEFHFINLNTPKWT